MSDASQNPETRIALFQRKEIRRTIHNNEWWFVITDVVAALTDSANPQNYFRDMRRRDLPLAETLKGGGQFAPPLGLEFETAGGRQLLQCWNTEGIFRLIQSIPSPKAEPFKRWLAKVGYERIQEIEDPELATKRTCALYKAKGYSDDWIEKRMRSIAIRDELTGEWQKRGVKEQREYAILTASKRKAAAKLSPAKTTFPSPNPRRQLNPCATPPPPNCQGRAVLRRGLHSRKGAWPPNPRLKKVNVNRNRENEETQKPCQYRKEREPRNTRNTRTPIFFGGKGLDFSRISRISRFKKFLRRGFGGKGQD